MSRTVDARRFGRGAQATGPKPFVLNYGAWHAHLAGRAPLEVPMPVAPAQVVRFDFAAWHARLSGADRKAA